MCIKPWIVTSCVFLFCLIKALFSACLNCKPRKKGRGKRSGRGRALVCFSFRKSCREKHQFWLTFFHCTGDLNCASLDSQTKLDVGAILEVKFYWITPDILFCPVCIQAEAGNLPCSRTTSGLAGAGDKEVWLVWLSSGGMLRRGSQPPSPGGAMWGWGWLRAWDSHGWGATSSDSLGSCRGTEHSLGCCSPPHFISSSPHGTAESQPCSWGGPWRGHPSVLSSFLSRRGRTGMLLLLTTPLQLRLQRGSDPSSFDSFVQTISANLFLFLCVWRRAEPHTDVEQHGGIYEQRQELFGQV